MENHPTVQALSDFNGIPYPSFYNYDLAYDPIFLFKDLVGPFFTVGFSILYASSNLHTLGVLLRWV